MQLAHPRLSRELLWIIGGPLLVGACLGAPFELAVFLRTTIGVPAVYFGVALLMAPALYFAGAFLGVTPPVHQMVVAVRATLRELGILLVGLAPALLFLVVSAQRGTTVMVLGHVVLGLATLVVLVAFNRRLFAGQPRRVVAFLFYMVWSALCIGIGWRAFLSIFAS